MTEDDYSLTLGNAEKHQAGHNKRATSRHKNSWTVVIEEWTDLHPDKENEEQVQTKDPSNIGMGIVFELIIFEMGFKDSTRVDESVNADHGTEGAEHHEPGC